MIVCPLDEIISDYMKRLLLIMIFPVIYIQQFVKTQEMECKIKHLKL